MKAFLSTCGCFALAFSSVSAADWEPCRGVTGAFNVSSLAVTPDPIETGLPATFSLDTNHDVDVHEGTLHAKVHYFGVKVYEKSGSLCDPIDCPLKPGNNLLDFTEEMPVFLPPGKISLTLHAKRSDDMDLFCVKIDLLKKKKSDEDATATTSYLSGMLNKLSFA
jgi:hypothetical protein